MTNKSQGNGKTEHSFVCVRSPISIYSETVCSYDCIELKTFKGVCVEILSVS